MNENINPVIVVIAYNRANCIRRLLNALESAEYDTEVLLIISIDYGDNQDVVDIAQKFKWKHGEKIVRTFNENQGCKNHVIKCIDYCLEYGAAIIFEDDILPSVNFYSYVKNCLKVYSSCDNIFAFALHNQLWNGFADKLFVPVRNRYDAYLAQRVCSWGECFVGDKWKGFKEWYVRNENISRVLDNMPQVIYEWSESWGKYVWNYITENNLYFVIPYDSLTTRFNDIGVHFNEAEIKYKCQVPLAEGKEKYELPNINAAVKYDAFFESIDLKENIEKKYGKITVVDYYGTRHNYGKAQLCLTRKELPYKILATYGDDMVQPEWNYFYNIEGEDIALYDLEKSAEIVKRCHNSNSIYFGNELEIAKEVANKHLLIMNIFSRWLKIVQQGKNISKYLKKRGVENIAIYGMGMLGERLYDELNNAGIIVLDCFDRDRKRYRNIQIKSITNISTEIDYIIVTAVYYYSDIKKYLEQQTNANIVSLQEIIEQLEDKREHEENG